MEINLLKLKLNNPHGGICGLSVLRRSWKYRPIDFCCENMKEAFGEKFDKFIKFRDEFMPMWRNEDEASNTDLNIPHLCLTTTERVANGFDSYTKEHNYAINFCPFCGQKITINVVELDFTSEYSQLVSLREINHIKSTRDGITVDEKRFYQKEYDRIIETINYLNEFIEVADVERLRRYVGV